MTRPNLTLALAILLPFGLAGCKSNTTTAPIVAGTADNGTDPADANLAAGGSTQVLGTSSSYTPQQQGESYPQQQPAPIVQGSDQSSYDQNDQANSQPDEQTDQAPPPLPTYDQPPAPGPNYLWTPGYWAYAPSGYYWVPGAWCPPPYYGALWTPPYWGYNGSRYGFHHGYWGPHIGFYGGVDYGFGYIGIGYFGGYWRGHDFYYNRSVTNVGRVTNVYNHTVVYNNVHYGMQPSNRVSYNGGRGGINVAPRPAELAAMHETHAAPLREQVQVRQQAAQNRGNFYATNNGRPAQAVLARPVAENHSIAEAPRAVQQQQQHNAITERAAQPQQRPQQHPEQRPQQNPEQHATQPQRATEPQRTMEPQHTQPQPRPIQRSAPATAPSEHQQPERQQPEHQQPARQQPAPQQARPQPEPQRAQPQPHAAPQQHAAPHAEPHEENHPK